MTKALRKIRGYVDRRGSFGLEIVADTLYRTGIYIAENLIYPDSPFRACQFFGIITARRLWRDGQKDSYGQDCDNDRACQEVEE